jgi:hypothetical protein
MASGKALMEAVTHAEAAVKEILRLEAVASGGADQFAQRYKAANKTRLMARENLQAHIKRTYGVYAYRLKEVL